ncbi:carbamoyltransferase HypF [Myxococcota bacterium]|nr:carbamoyltransferase HypF [Myxococcota bacterium]
MRVTQAVRQRLEVRGRVQGVGFRPFVYTLAASEALSGFVGNDERGVFIEVEGPPPRVARFVERLSAEAPPLSRIHDLACADVALRGEPGFHILKSTRAQAAEVEIAPDANTCPACLRELLDKGDRRAGYPFINCTHCGPRYTIVLDRPYDRAVTTMASFPMCAACQAEYDDPHDRRFHAQPNACPRCGPRVWLSDPQGRELAGAPFAQVQARLLAGEIIAIKGLGGFHLACRAEDDEAVRRLRARKGRAARPFALMVPDVDAAHRLVKLTPQDQALLESVARPILLCPRREGAAISPAVAPSTDRLGLMLPYTPLHHLLFQGAALGPLVMTSANPNAEPLCVDNDEALSRLAGLADALLLHDRPIARGVDDSVILGGPDALPIRRARGYVPEPLWLSLKSPAPILALGGELKSTLCLLRGHEAILSEHLGTLSNPAALRNFLGRVADWPRFFEIEPAYIAVDLHPGYASTRHAAKLDRPIIKVQHHHAHLAACLAEHGLEGPAIGLIADGTGYGTDGQIWGGEILLGDLARFDRIGSLYPFTLQGGDAAAYDPWRPAAALLLAALGEIPEGSLPVPSALATRLMTREALQTTSLGRLFDGVASILGICSKNRFEAEAAMALEALAVAAPQAPALPWALIEAEGQRRIDWRPTVRALVASTAPLEIKAAGFHAALAAAFAEAAARTAAASGVGLVVLSGGCFINTPFRSGVRASLEAQGLRVLTHQRVPTGDGGLALGQAVVAAARLSAGLR